MCVGYQKTKASNHITTFMRSSSTYSKDLEDLSTTVMKIIEDDPHS
jgi:hypothetical protein